MCDRLRSYPAARDQTPHGDAAEETIGRVFQVVTRPPAAGSVSHYASRVSTGNLPEPDD
jgi:hypothetical protein